MLNFSFRSLVYVVVQDAMYSERIRVAVIQHVFLNLSKTLIYRNNMFYYIVENTEKTILFLKILFNRVFCYWNYLKLMVAIESIVHHHHMYKAMNDKWQPHVMFQNVVNQVVE